MADHEKPRSCTAPTPEGDDALLLALAGGKSQTAAAELAGVCRDTVQRRLRDPEFRARIEAARSDMIERAVGQMAEAAVEAVATLRNLLTNDKTPAVQAAAAGKILANLNLGERDCRECKRRADEAKNPPPLTVAQQMAQARWIKSEYAKIMQQEAEAARLNKIEEEEMLKGRTPMKVLAYEDG
jgi:hypothetical protein